MEKQFTKEDYIKSLEKRSPEVRALLEEVIEDPSYWTLARFIRRYGLLPRRFSEAGNKVERAPSDAKRNWNMMKRHGFELVD